MMIRKSAYFDAFVCIADRCPDSCCKDWQVQVDAAAAERYLALEGPLGDALRSALTLENGGYEMANSQGRCPMWRSDGLCRIQAELGEGALCATCREFPRLTHDYGDFQERTLELSCPEAARLILSSPPLPTVEVPALGTGEADYDREAMEVLLQTRQQMLAILSDTARPVGQTLALALLYGCQAQSELDQGEMRPFDPEQALVTARQLAGQGSEQGMLDFFRGQEILTQAWLQRLERPEKGPWQEAHLALARYFVERYWLQAVADYDLYSRVKLMIVGCLAVRLLGGDVTATAQAWSKENENSIENLEAILDGAYTCPAFTDDKLLGLLLDQSQ